MDKFKTVKSKNYTMKFTGRVITPTDYFSQRSPWANAKELHMDLDEFLKGWRKETVKMQDRSCYHFKVKSNMEIDFRRICKENPDAKFIFVSPGGDAEIASFLFDEKYFPKEWVKKNIQYHLVSTYFKHDGRDYYRVDVAKENLEETFPIIRERIANINKKKEGKRFPVRVIAYN